MKKIRKFTDLEAWQVVHQLRIAVLKEIRSFPKEYDFGLSTQIQRSAVSVGSNIAEGFGRISVKEKLRFYDIARGSLTELQDKLITARDIGVLESSRFNTLAEMSVRSQKLINGLMWSLRTTNSELRDTLHV
ncbi:MAG TPA: four helix bundle protein [Candidatus Saccharimonadales bacterium]